LNIPWPPKGVTNSSIQLELGLPPTQQRPTHHNQIRRIHTKIRRVNNTQTRTLAQTHTHTRVAAFKNKFEYDHDVIDGVNIWQENCIEWGSKAPPSLAEG